MHSSPSQRQLLRSLAALALLSLPASAQTYTARAGASIAGNDSQSISAFPTETFWDGTWTHATRHAYSRADQGFLRAQALCTVDALYNESAYGIAQCEYDDVVFTSPGTTPIQVGLHLTIDGNSSVVNGNSFSVTVRQGLVHVGTATRVASGLVTASGGLNGWSMTGPHSFVVPITVPVNTPVPFRTYLSAGAGATAGGHNSNGHYWMRFGAAVPVFPSCDQFEVFSLPSGVSVHSVQAGIADNLWSKPSPGTSYCSAAPNSVSASGALISASGTAHVSANDLVLNAGPIPVGASGIFFHGSSPTQMPFGEGYLCSSGPHIRVGPILAADASGFLIVPFDFTGPHGTGIQPGLSRYFQLWYRDPLGGDMNNDGFDSGFNASDGLELCFY